MYQFSQQIAVLIFLFRINAFPITEEIYPDLCNSSFACDNFCEIISNPHNGSLDVLSCAKVGNSCISATDWTELIRCKNCLNDQQNDTCELECSQVCIDFSCTNITHLLPECSQCPPGFFGPDCDRYCSERCHGSCYSLTGYCKNCGRGRYGLRCERHCSQHCQDGQCSTEDGSCFRCKKGRQGKTCEEICSPRYFGENCENACPETCEQSTCHAVTGTCTDGCERGYYGASCERMCPNGTYGIGCMSQCSATCSEDSTCHHVSGKCLEGCGPGFRGDECDVVCSYGTYGKNCAQNCSSDCFLHVCNPFSGHCKRCVKGRYGPFCEYKAGLSSVWETNLDSEMTLDKIIFMFVGLFAMGVTVWLLLALLMYQRRKMILKKIERTGKIPDHWAAALQRYQTISNLSNSRAAGQKLRASKLRTGSPTKAKLRANRMKRFRRTLKLPKKKKIGEPFKVVARKQVKKGSPDRKGTNETALPIKDEKKTKSQEPNWKIAEPVKPETGDSGFLKEILMDGSLSAEDTKTVASLRETAEESLTATVAENAFSTTSSRKTKKTAQMQSSSTPTRTGRESTEIKETTDSTPSKIKSIGRDEFEVTETLSATLNRLAKETDKSSAEVSSIKNKPEPEGVLKPWPGTMQKTATSTCKLCNADSYKCICSVRALQGSTVTSKLQETSTGESENDARFGISFDNPSPTKDELIVELHQVADHHKTEKKVKQQNLNISDVTCKGQPKLLRATTRVRSLENNQVIKTPRRPSRTSGSSTTKQSSQKVAGRLSGSGIQISKESGSASHETESETVSETESNSEYDSKTGSSSTEHEYRSDEFQSSWTRKRSVSSSRYQEHVKHLLDARREQNLRAALIRQSQPSDARAQTVHMWNPAAKGKTGIEEHGFMQKGYKNLAFALGRLIRPFRPKRQQPFSSQSDRQPGNWHTDQKRHASMQFMLSRLESWRRSGGLQHDIRDGVFELATKSCSRTTLVSYSTSVDYTSSDFSGRTSGESNKSSDVESSLHEKKPHSLMAHESGKSPPSVGKYHPRKKGKKTSPSNSSSALSASYAETSETKSPSFAERRKKRKIQDVPMKRSETPKHPDKKAVAKILPGSPTKRKPTKAATPYPTTFTKRNSPGKSYRAMPEANHPPRVGRLHRNLSHTSIGMDSNRISGKDNAKGGSSSTEILEPIGSVVLSPSPNKLKSRLTKQSKRPGKVQGRTKSRHVTMTRESDSSE